MASEPAAAFIDCAGAPSSDDAALHAVSDDFPQILVSLARASILSTLPVTASTEPFSAPRLVVNHCCTAVESDAGGAGALEAQSSGWHDTCPLAAASWLADMSGVDLGKELAVIRRYLLRALPDLVSVDETAAAALVLDLLGAEQATEVIAALDKFPRLQVSLFSSVANVGTHVPRMSPTVPLQFAYLTSYLRRAGMLDESTSHQQDQRKAPLPRLPVGSVQQPVAGLSADVHLRYITLLCSYKPEAVLAYLMGSATYPLEATLSVVQTAGILEAVAYLKEHTGDSKGALEVRESC